MDIEEKNKEIIEEQEESKLRRFFKELIPYVIIIVVVLFVKNYIIAPVQVRGDSMDSTLQSGDVMLLNRLQFKRYGVKRFDIVVVDDHDTYIIKRIIGLPGDIVEIKDERLIINGEEFDEYYLDEGTHTDDLIVEVPKGHYYILGDNREESLDSRILGPIEEDKIQGIAKITIFPLNRIGTKK